MIYVGFVAVDVLVLLVPFGGLDLFGRFVCDSLSLAIAISLFALHVSLCCVGTPKRNVVSCASLKFSQFSIAREQRE